MFTYYVYNKTRKSWCVIDSSEFIEVGQTVLVKFENEELADELCECEVVKMLSGYNSWES